MVDWPTMMANWAYAYGVPSCTAVLKAEPADFKVVEVMPVTPSGEGEHVWIKIQKTHLNTEQVAKQLARLGGVPHRSVSYSGRKDFQAITEQWFSVWMPGLQEPDWLSLQDEKLAILQTSRHHKKLRVGTHSENRFEIRLKDLRGDKQAFLRRLNSIASEGVPNYFGEQRFGRGGNNVQRALDLFAGKIRIKDKRERGLLFSSARAWLFNQCLSARVQRGDWATLSLGEPVMLAGSESYFIAEQASQECADLKQRLLAGDIHPSAPLLGRWREENVAPFWALHERELGDCQSFQSLVDGLQQAGLDYARRATRCIPKDLSYEHSDSEAVIKFSLPRGQFATAVIRELVLT